MIKGNECDVGSIDFEIKAKIGDKLLCLILFVIFKDLFIIPQQPDVKFRWGLDRNSTI